MKNNKKTLSIIMASAMGLNSILSMQVTAADSNYFLSAKTTAEYAYNSSRVIVDQPTETYTTGYCTGTTTNTTHELLGTCHGNCTTTTTTVTGVCGEDCTTTGTTFGTGTELTNGSLYLYQKPDKLTYEKGESLDLTGGKVQPFASNDFGVHACGAPVDMTSDDENMVIDASEFNSEVDGIYTIYIYYTYQGIGMTTYFDVVVGDAAEYMVTQASLYLYQKPDKLNYEIGESLDLTGGKIQPFGSNNFGLNAMGNVIDMTSDDIKIKIDTSEFNSQYEGVYTIYVYYEFEGISVWTSFDVTVGDVESEIVTTTNFPEDILTGVTTDSCITGDIDDGGYKCISGIVKEISTTSLLIDSNYYLLLPYFNKDIISEIKVGDIVTLDVEIIGANNISDITDVNIDFCSVNYIEGDANADGQTAVADAVAVSAYVSDANKNNLSMQGTVNADVYMTGDGLNANDALVIQQIATGIIS